ncbi:hypothetical protein ADUPG1_006884 [Aduncisulcus paluster]|uniref:Uncharacterized protein n=1 Tax=Aduncisulcus paluster TaxID=2918883 RepID=A0ABQ5KJY0_9EUKA|nr:hypothetical protein ADUPG1_006884 [Aduncisulcus paluster]
MDLDDGIIEGYLPRSKQTIFLNSKPMSGRVHLVKPSRRKTPSRAFNYSPSPSVPIRANTTPGPGTYNPRPKRNYGSFSPYGSSSLGASTKPRFDYKYTSMPAVGAYDSSSHDIVPRTMKRVQDPVQSQCFSLPTSKSRKSAISTSHLGPGAYTGDIIVRSVKEVSRRPVPFNHTSSTSFGADIRAKSGSFSRGSGGSRLGLRRDKDPEVHYDDLKGMGHLDLTLSQSNAPDRTIKATLQAQYSKEAFLKRMHDEHDRQTLFTDRHHTDTDLIDSGRSPGKIAGRRSAAISAGGAISASGAIGTGEVFDEFGRRIMPYSDVHKELLGGKPCTRSTRRSQRAQRSQRSRSSGVYRRGGSRTSGGPSSSSSSSSSSFSASIIRSRRGFYDVEDSCNNKFEVHEIGSGIDEIARKMKLSRRRAMEKKEKATLQCDVVADVHRQLKQMKDSMEGTQESFGFGSRSKRFVQQKKPTTVPFASSQSSSSSSSATAAPYSQDSIYRTSSTTTSSSSSYHLHMAAAPSRSVEFARQKQADDRSKMVKLQSAYANHLPIGVKAVQMKRKKAVTAGPGDFNLDKPHPMPLPVSTSSFLTPARPSKPLGAKTITPGPAKYGRVGVESGSKSFRVGGNDGVFVC